MKFQLLKCRLAKNGSINTIISEGYNSYTAIWSISRTNKQWRIKLTKVLYAMVFYDDWAIKRHHLISTLVLFVPLSDLSSDIDWARKQLKKGVVLPNPVWRGELYLRCNGKALLPISDYVLYRVAEKSFLQLCGFSWVFIFVEKSRSVNFFAATTFWWRLYLTLKTI